MCMDILEFVHQFWPFLCCAGKWLVALAFLETGFLLVPLLLWTTVAVVVLQTGELLIHIDVYSYNCFQKYTDVTAHCDLSWQGTRDQLILSSFNYSTVSFFVLAVIIVAVIASTYVRTYVYV